MPRRWHMRSLLMIVGVLIALGVIKFKWQDAGPGLRIDLERTAQIEKKAGELLKAAADRLEKNR